MLVQLLPYTRFPSSHPTLWSGKHHPRPGHLSHLIQTDLFKETSVKPPPVSLYAEPPVLSAPSVLCICLLITPIGLLYLSAY